MSQRLREKIALVGFSCFLLLFASAMIFMGLNEERLEAMADRLGGNALPMTGYVAITYDGVLEGDDQTDFEGFDEATIAQEGVDSDVSAEQLEKEAQPSAKLEPGSSNVPSVIFSDVSPDISTAEVNALYEEQGASVLSLNMDDPYAYTEGMILMRGDGRFGVIGVTADTTVEELKEIRKRFKKAAVNGVVIVEIEPNDAIRQIKANVVVQCFGDEEGALQSADVARLTGKAYYAIAPMKGDVGAIVISPGGTIYRHTY